MASSTVKSKPIKRFGKLGKAHNDLLADVLALEAWTKAQLNKKMDDANTITLKVCIDGEVKYIDVYLGAGPRDTE